MGFTIVTRIESFFQYTEAGSKSVLFNQKANSVSESFIQTLRDGDVLVAAYTGLIMNITSPLRPDIYNITDLIRQGALTASLNEDETIHFFVPEDTKLGEAVQKKLMGKILKLLNDPASASEIQGYEHCRKVLFAQTVSVIPVNLMNRSLTAGE